MLPGLVLRKSNDFTRPQSEKCHVVLFTLEAVLDPDPNLDPVGSASFCRIGIGIQGLPGPADPVLYPF